MPDCASSWAVTPDPLAGAMAERLFERWTDVSLYVPPRSVPPIWRLDFPTAAYPGELPGLLTVEWPDTGRKKIAGTGRWGNPAQPADATAVNVAPDFSSALARDGQLPNARHHVAHVRRARLWEILLYKGGFATQTGLTPAVAAAAVGRAILTFVAGEEPFAWGLVAPHSRLPRRARQSAERPPCLDSRQRVTGFACN